MKKIVIAIIALSSVVLFNACKKKNEVVSQVETYSVPTITISGAQFYSIPLNGSLPEISATAYDSVRKEFCTTKVEAGTLDNTTPGLYPVAIRATNSVGMYSKLNVFVAVTNVASDWSLSGAYKRTSNGCPVNVLEVANGLYEVDNVGGAPSLPIVGYFVQINDSMITFPEQPTEAGTMDCLNETLKTLPGDTSYSWKVDNPSFGTALRVFQKQ